MEEEVRPNADIDSLTAPSVVTAPAAAAAAAKNARLFVAAAAEGRISSADELLPWPPPPPSWRERTSSAIFSAAALARENQQQPKLWLQQQQFLLPLNEPFIDAVLGGGLPAGMLGEVCGAAGAGKTQLALTLTAECLLQKLKHQQQRIRDACIGGGGLKPPSFLFHRTVQHAEGKEDVDTEQSTGVVLYIHSEGSFPAERLHGILSRRLEALQHQPGDPGEALESKNAATESWASAAASHLLSRVFVEEVGSEEEAVDCLLYKVARLFISQGRIILLVVDSVAALFKHEMQTQRNAPTTGSNTSSAASRSAKLIRFGALLRRIAAEYNCCCLTLNHVSAVMTTDSTAGREASELHLASCTADALKRRRMAEGSIGCWMPEQEVSRVVGFVGKSANLAYWAAADSLSSVRPALGLVWSGCLNYRIFLSRVEPAQFVCTTQNRPPSDFQNLRSIFVVFAPHCPEGAALFTVNEKGIVEVKETKCSDTMSASDDNASKPNSKP